jgi:hypothetical protein
MPISELRFHSRLIRFSGQTPTGATFLVATAMHNIFTR